MTTKQRRHWCSFILTIFFFLLAFLNLYFFGDVIYLEDDRVILSAEPIIVDQVAPSIKLEGSSKISILQNGVYEELGAKVFDNKSDPELMIDGSVDTKTIGEYKVTYSAVDDAGNHAEKVRTVKVIEPVKIVYLTFDDGPGQYTAELLDVLKKYNVKATFFVTGAGSDELIKREYDEGHAVALHTFSHNYSYIYSSTANFFEDLYKVQSRVERITGYKSFLMRFPGGSSNTVSYRYDGKTRIMSRLTKEVTEKGFTYFDWNITSGDAGQTTSTEQSYWTVLNQLKPYSSVVLQHDIKGFSVAAVERIIKYGLENGYTFMKLDASSPTAHHPTNN